MTPCTHDTLRRLPVYPAAYHCQCGFTARVEAIDYDCEVCTGDGKGDHSADCPLTAVRDHARDLLGLARSDAA